MGFFRSALGFFILALCATVWGQASNASDALPIARMLVLVFMGLAVVSFIIAIIKGVQK